jgi:hypothetical protein
MPGINQSTSSNPQYVIILTMCGCGGMGGGGGGGGGANSGVSSTMADCRAPWCVNCFRRSDCSFSTDPRTVNASWTREQRVEMGSAAERGG